MMEKANVITTLPDEKISIQKYRIIRVQKPMIKIGKSRDCHTTISFYDVDYGGKTFVACLYREEILHRITCAISTWKKDIKCIYIYIYSEYVMDDSGISDIWNSDTNVWRVNDWAKRTIERIRYCWNVWHVTYNLLLWVNGATRSSYIYATYMSIASVSSRFKPFWKLCKHKNLLWDAR